MFHYTESIWNCSFSSLKSKLYIAENVSYRFQESMWWWEFLTTHRCLNLTLPALLWFIYKERSPVEIYGALSLEKAWIRQYTCLTNKARGFEYRAISFWISIFPCTNFLTRDLDITCRVLWLILANNFIVYSSK